MRYQLKVTIGAPVVAIPTTVPWCTRGRYTDHGPLVHPWSLCRPRSPGAPVVPIPTTVPWCTRGPYTDHGPLVHPRDCAQPASCVHPLHAAYKVFGQAHHLAHAQEPSCTVAHIYHSVLHAFFCLAGAFFFLYVLPTFAFSMPVFRVPALNDGTNEYSKRESCARASVNSLLI